MTDLKLNKEQDFWRGSFAAMASPCEVLMEVEDEALAQKILQAVSSEAQRIEQKFSRYRDNNIIFTINNAAGKATQVDSETARLIDFCDNLYQLSDGLFDITSGVLRKVWKFDGSDNVPEPESINKILSNVGWHKVVWQNKKITMSPGMEIDLGGVGKEYAVDRCVQIVSEMTKQSVLINFGGDLATTCTRSNDGFWSVGRLITGKEHSVALFQLRKGAIATSGDAHRYLLKQGKRYSHVLNPKTGWPVMGAPHTVSISAPTCIEAGMLSTLAMLQGDQAEQFLKLQEIDYWVD
ncbi:MAG: FAD:protein FMN transferase [Gammaproteobacteria bacterium]|nr:FAD:protein FMN transferase [Gammaproteobacteria bacterium]